MVAYFNDDEVGIHALLYTGEEEEEEEEMRIGAPVISDASHASEFAK